MCTTGDTAHIDTIFGVCTTGDTAHIDTIFGVCTTGDTAHIDTIFGVCTTGDTAHIDTIFTFLPHTRQLARTRSTSSSAFNGRPLDCCLHRHAVSLNCLYQRTNGLVCMRVLCVLCTKFTLHSIHRLTLVIFQHTKRLLPQIGHFLTTYTRIA